MYIRRAVIENICSIRKLEWQPQQDKLAGWHVILGDNGSGKSTVLRAIALALAGPSEAPALRLDWQAFLRRDKKQGEVRLDLEDDRKLDRHSSQGALPKSGLHAAVQLYRENGRIRIESDKPQNRHVWGGGAGWFAAAYGPFRRFTGGDKDSERIFLSNPKLGALVSVFGESVALSECLHWLRDMHHKKLENSKNVLLDQLKGFVNQPGFLPNGVRLGDVSSEGVFFEDASGFQVPVEDLSDGYRSILSMTFELIRQLARAYGTQEIFEQNKVKLPGVVMIDEVDAHLHPSWQKQIGYWLTEHFPGIQFLVTTHSPLICHAAASGSIFRLPAAGSDEEGHMVEGSERDRLLYGDAVEAYSTMSFGAADTRSPDAHAMLSRLAALNVKSLNSSLTKEEEEECERLRLTFPRTASIGR